MIELIGIDVDGTLVGSSGQVSPQVWAAAERARATGIHLVLCSGRPAFGVALDYARRLDSQGWHIFQNGASVVNLSSGESRSAPLPADCVKELIAESRQNGNILELYSDSSYVTESTTAWAKDHARLLGVPFSAQPLESLTKPIVRAQWVLSAEQAQLALATRRPGLEIAQSTSPLMPDARFVGLTRAGVSKGSAIKTIAAAYRIDLREVMYVGDAGNDLSALRVVGCPVAMGNADPAVIAVARHTVGHVNAGGLAQAFDIAIASRTM